MALFRVLHLLKEDARIAKVGLAPQDRILPANARKPLEIRVGCMDGGSAPDGDGGDLSIGGEVGRRAGCL